MTLRLFVLSFAIGCCGRALYESLAPPDAGWVPYLLALAATVLAAVAAASTLPESRHP